MTLVLFSPLYPYVFILSTSGDHGIPDREIKIKEIEHKARSIEFERGLRRKLKAGESDEIIHILQKYVISASLVDKVQK